MPKMTRLGLLILPTMLLIGCSAPFIGSVNISLDGPAPEAPTLAADERSCPEYKPMPDSLKAFAAKQNDTDPAINPWAGWLLNLRQWLEGGCQ